MAGEFLSYEQVPYLGRIHYQSHINNLAVAATLFGMQPAPPDRCRVLEIGCADGSNIITMGYHLPNSTFVGVDGAPSQIESGRQIVAELGLDNVELRAADLRDLGEDLGEFDYIIAHGIFSWIAEDAREALLELCRRHLAPQGVAYVSYNCYPGWHFYNQLRGIMRFHVRGMSTIQEEIDQARAIVRFVGSAIVDTGSPRAEFFKAVLPTVQTMNPDYLYHEYLEENNRPMYFHEFITQAIGHKLQYLGESVFHSMMTTNYPPEIRDTLDRISNNIVELEQYMDFLRNRRFRCTLLCHDAVGLERSVELDPVAGFRVGFSYRSDDPDNDLYQPTPLAFSDTDDAESSVTVQAPLHKLALSMLSAAWPEALPFEDVAASCCAKLDREVTPEVRSELSDLFMKLFIQGFGEFFVTQPPLTSTISQRPEVSRLARYQACNARVISSQRHEMVQLNDNQSRAVIARLDGSRTLDDVVDELLPLLEEESRAAMSDPRGVLRTSVEMILKRLAREGLLIPDGAEAR